MFLNRLWSISPYAYFIKGLLCGPNYWAAPRPPTTTILSFFPLLVGTGCPTDPFTNLELQNPSHDVRELHEIHLSPDHEDLKLWKGRSGGACKYIGTLAHLLSEPWTQLSYIVCSQNRKGVVYDWRCVSVCTNIPNGIWIYHMQEKGRP